MKKIKLSINRKKTKLNIKTKKMKLKISIGIGLTVILHIIRGIIVCIDIIALMIAKRLQCARMRHIMM